MSGPGPPRFVTDRVASIALLPRGRRAVRVPRPLLATRRKRPGAGQISGGGPASTGTMAG